MKIFAGNWKMNKTSKEAFDYLKKFKALIKKSKDTIILAVPFTVLPILAREIKGTNIKLSAQDVYFEEKGAFTGEISPCMVKEFAEYVIIGHSERRKYFQEDDYTLYKKVLAAKKSGLGVIFCVGETIEHRIANKTKKVLMKQLDIGLGNAKLTDVIIAYEPVWAIGTGNTASPEQIKEVHSFIKGHIKRSFRKNLRVIYGGSVNSKNSKEILSIKEVDGCLPGGASLDPVEFSRIIFS